jgi:hypothetical protein
MLTKATLISATETDRALACHISMTIVLSIDPQVRHSSFTLQDTYLIPGPGLSNTTDTSARLWRRSHASSGLRASVMPLLGLSCRHLSAGHAPRSWILFLLFALCAVAVKAMSPERIEELRLETVDMFYHGFNNYMDVAFPEDEVIPSSFSPSFTK